MAGPDRTCGDCSVCCTVAAVPALGKATHSACAHDGPNGCEIYGSDDRPRVCAEFRCSWLRGIGREEDRPDRSGVMLSYNLLNGGMFGFAILLRRCEPLPEILLTAARMVRLPIVVVDHRSRPPFDTGDYVLISEELAPRAKTMLGPLMRTYPQHVRLHRLAEAA